LADVSIWEDPPRLRIDNKELYSVPTVFSSLLAPLDGDKRLIFQKLMVIQGETSVKNPPKTGRFFLAIYFGAILSQIRMGIMM
jgi:hypothetical protein